jgi:predicted GNAT family acetyltransferase
VSSSSSPEVTVRNDAAKSRYEAVIDGAVVGVADYRLDGDHVVFPHVEVTPKWEGKGVASTLVREALDEVIAAGKRITPQCPFVVGFVEEHPEYAEHTG